MGTQLMQISEDIARRHHTEMIFLKAMDSSPDAIRFYQKMGYTICGSLTLPFPLMKKEFRGMVILQKETPSLPGTKQAESETKNF